MAPYSATTVANEFIELALREGRPLTHMKLQKLVYLAHGWHLGLLDAPLIREKVLAWEYGPVIREMYAEFARYGRDPITEKHHTLVVVDGEPEALDMRVPDSDSDAHQVIEAVWGVYRDSSAFALSSLTHQPDTPWDMARQSQNSEIPIETIREHFKQFAAA